MNETLTCNKKKITKVKKYKNQQFILILIESRLQVTSITFKTIIMTFQNSIGFVCRSIVTSAIIKKKIIINI